jgi:hypothetical protein
LLLNGWQVCRHKSFRSFFAEMLFEVFAHFGFANDYVLGKVGLFEQANYFLFFIAATK